LSAFATVIHAAALKTERTLKAAAIETMSLFGARTGSPERGYATADNRRRAIARAMRQSSSPATP